MAIEPKLINVYIAATEELTMEYLELADLLSHLNKKIFPRRNIKLNLVKHNANMGEVKDCELCLSLYWTNFGDYSQEELKEAYEELQGGRNPRKLYVFFKDSKEVTPELQAFKDSFSTDFGHFFCRFENVDTMKLHFFLQLEAYQNNIQKKLLKVENQKVLIEGEEIVDLNKVPFAAMNKEFCRMRDEIEKAEINIAQFRSFLATMDNPAIQAMLDDNLATRNKLEEQLKEHQEFLFDMARKTSQLSSQRMSARSAEAIRLFNEGKATEANAILNTEDLSRDSQKNFDDLDHHTARAEEARERIELLLNDWQLKTNSALADENLTVEERIEEAYNAHEQVVIHAKKLKYQEYDKAKLASLVFEFAYFTQKYNLFSDAIRLYEEALSIYKPLAEKEPNVYMSYAATTLNNLAVLCSDTNCYEQAEQSYLQALSIYKTLAEKEPNVYMSDVANILNNLGLLYFDTNRYEQSEQNYLRALSISEPLSEKVPNVYMYDVAMTLNNLANLYRATNRYDQAEQSYLRVLSIRESLAEKEPNVYMPDVATTLNNLAVLYTNQNCYEQAEQSYLRALSIYEILAKKEPNVYMPYVAITLNNLAVLYSDTNRYEQSEHSYLRALSIREPLAEKEPNVYMPDVATTLNNLAVLYYNTSRYEQAGQSYLRALSIRETLAEKEPDVYLPDVALTLNNLGILHETKTKNMQMAEHYYTKAANIYSQLYDKFGEQFIGQYINVLRNLLDVFDTTGQTENAAQIRKILGE